ncbi:hypothetical protein MKW94_017791, partial [Papaver nudicaule]|nr:hypothetical protein [Papaver nudicaule]
FVCAVTGEPVSAQKAIGALTGKIEELEKEGSPRLTAEKAAKLVPKFGINEPTIEFLAVGRDWDELRGEFVPCLSYANKAASRNPKKGYCTGLGAICSQMVVDNLFKKEMSIEAAVEVALQALYFAAFSHEVKGQTVEAIEVCVISGESINTSRYTVEHLHKKFAHLVKERHDYLRSNPAPR